MTEMPDGDSMANVSMFSSTNNSGNASLIAYSGSMFLIGAWIVCSNMLVILATLRTPKLRKRTGIFVANLAAADILSGIFVPLFWLMGKIAMPETGGKYVCGFYLTMQLLPLAASIANLLLIAIDRYLAIVYPLRTRGVMTKTHCKQLASMGWAYSIIVTVIVIPWNQYPGSGPCSLFHMANYYFYLVTQIPFWLSLVAMTYMYGSIVYTVQKHCKFITDHAHRSSLPPTPSLSDKPSVSSLDRNTVNPPGGVSVNETKPLNSTSGTMTKGGTLGREEKKMANEINLTKMVVLVLGIFCICWIPMVITYTLYLSGYKREKMYLVASAAGVFAYINSGMNFILYALRSHEYRKAFKEILTCKQDTSMRAPDSFTHSTSV